MRYREDRIAQAEREWADMDARALAEFIKSAYILIRISAFEESYIRDVFDRVFVQVEADRTK